jgi:voltage-gated potassium channel Kch
VRALVIGDLEVTRATCAMLADRGIDVLHLLHPTDVELRERLDTSFDAVAVLVRGDVTALRYVLLVEQIKPGVRLLATVFDRTLATKLEAVVPNCSVDSPGDIAVPSIAAACLGDETLAVDFSKPSPRRLVRDDDGRLSLLPYVAGRRHGSVSRGLVGRLAAHDDATRILLLGLAGLLSILLIDWAVLALTLHASPLEALYAATRVVTTVGPGDADRDGRAWYLVLSITFMLATVILTALFTAATVERVMSSRALTLVGRRVPPRGGHVVIVGLGQVGMRLANALLQLSISVIVVERDPGAVNLRLARGAGIPVFIGDGHDVATLRRVGIHRARAVAAMASADLDNIEVAIAASAVAPQIPIALRAGEDDLISETRSLFRIGEVRNVSGLTAAAVVERLQQSEGVIAFVEKDRVTTYDGATENVIRGVRRCHCNPG